MTTTTILITLILIATSQYLLLRKNIIFLVVPCVFTLWLTTDVLIASRWLFLFSENFNCVCIWRCDDLGESNGSRTCNIFSFLLDWNAHLERYILLKTPLELVQWFQGYDQLKILRTMEIVEIHLELLAISHNQYCQLPTDPARSQHI